MAQEVASLDSTPTASRDQKVVRTTVLLVAFVAVAVAVPLAAGAAGGRAASVYVDVFAGGSQHLRVGTPVARVSVAGKDVADVQAYPPDELVITGRRVGETEIIATDRSGEAHIYIVRVTPAVDGLRERMSTLFPGQKIEVHGVAASIVLTGSVRDASMLTDTTKIAEAHAVTMPGVSVTNLLQVTGTPQVQLEVRFAEVSRSALRQIGFNFWARNLAGPKANTNIAGGLLSPGTSSNGLAPNLGDPSLQLPEGMPIIQNPVNGAFSLLFATGAHSSFPLTAALGLLASHGFAKTLAEPTLVALSGHEASFLVLWAYAFGIAFAFNLWDWLVIDWFVFCAITPKWLVIPGSEGHPAYKNYLFHFRGFLIGTAFCAALGVVAAAIVTLADQR